MKLLPLVVILLSVVALASAMTAYWQIRQQDPTFLKEEFLPMDVKVEDHFGFNTDTDAVHFGKVPPANEGGRVFTLNNTYDFPVIAEFMIGGDIASWVSSTENLVYLLPYASKQVNLTVTVPAETPYGLYTGTLRVVFRKEDA